MTLSLSHHENVVVIQIEKRSVWRQKRKFTVFQPVKERVNKGLLTFPDSFSLFSVHLLPPLVVCDGVGWRNSVVSKTTWVDSQERGVFLFLLSQRHGREEVRQNDIKVYVYRKTLPKFNSSNLPFSLTTRVQFTETRWTMFHYVTTGKPSCNRCKVNSLREENLNYTEILQSKIREQ